MVGVGEIELEVDGLSQLTSSLKPTRVTQIELEAIVEGSSKMSGMPRLLTCGLLQPITWAVTV